MHLRVHFCILLLTAVPFSCGQILPLLFEFDYELPELIAETIIILLRKLTIGIDIMIAFESIPQKSFQLDTLNAVLKQLGTTTTVSLCGFWEQSHSMLIFADTHMSFRKALLSNDNNQYEFQGYFLVYLTDVSSYEAIDNVFKDCLEHNIINVAVIIAEGFIGKNELSLFTYFPFGNNECFNHEPVFWCIYSEHVFYALDEICEIYPEKLSSFYGCQLIVNSFEMAPYLTLTNDSGGSSALAGLEGQVVNTLAKKLNFVTAFVRPDRYKTPSKIDAFTSGPANVSVGRLRTTTVRRRNVSSSTSYYQSDLVVVTRLGRRLYSLERLFSPASFGVWFFLLVVMITAYSLVIVVQKKLPAAREFILGAGNRQPTYWVWVTTLGGPVEYRPRRNFARFMLLQWIGLNFFIRSGYQSFFYKSIQMNWRTDTANSLGEVLSQGYDLEATLETLNSLSEVRQLADHVSVFNGSEMDMLQSLDRIERKRAVILPYEVFQYYQRMNSNSNLTMIKEPVLEHMICMHFRTNSYLKGPFDRILMTLGESGLLAHWRTIYVPLPEKSKSTEMVPKEISFADVKGHFQLYALGILISFMGLGIELISLKVRFLRMMFTQEY